jgi:transposase
MTQALERIRELEERVRSLERDRERLIAAARGVCQAFDDGRFERNTDEDIEPAWAVKFAEPIRCLGVLREFAHDG